MLRATHFQDEKAPYLAPRGPILQQMTRQPPKIPCASDYVQQSYCIREPRLARCLAPLDKPHAPW